VCRVLGRAALELFQQHSYDVVVTDWDMPGVSGLELLREIRRHATRGRTPVLLMTGFFTAQRIADAFHAGANGFVAKPFVEAALTEHMLRIVKGLRRGPDVTAGTGSGYDLEGSNVGES
jgi:two-component system chemotaxis response regulator CheY